MGHHVSFMNWKATTTSSLKVQLTGHDVIFMQPNTTQLRVV
jgi:hypothetical protein